MSYNYYDPATVLSPKSCIDKVEVIFDGGVNNGAFSVAKVVWNGEVRIAVRWNITEREWGNSQKRNGSVRCVGEPNSRGYPTWFILPNLILTSFLEKYGDESENGKIIKEGIQKALKEIDNTIV